MFMFVFFSQTVQTNKKRNIYIHFEEEKIIYLDILLKKKRPNEKNKSRGDLRGLNSLVN